MKCLICYLLLNTSDFKHSPNHFVDRTIVWIVCQEMQLCFLSFPARLFYHASPNDSRNNKGQTLSISSQRGWLFCECNFLKELLVICYTFATVRVFLWKIEIRKARFRASIAEQPYLEFGLTLLNQFFI